VQLASFNILTENVFQSLDDIEERLQGWSLHWDDLYDGWFLRKVFRPPIILTFDMIEYGYEAVSLQRVSLQGQKNYGIVFLGCALIGRLKADLLLSDTLQMPEKEHNELLRRIVATASRQLDLVLRSDSYRWHLKWATSYTALSLTFTSKSTL
jgi:hypothetical protein